MTKNDIIAKVSEIWGVALKTFNIKDKRVPEVGFFSKSGVAGMAYYQEHKVTFNEILALENADTFETTIGHEIAHLVTHQLYPNAKQHHGPEFRHVMETLGYDARTYHTYNTDSVKTKRVKTRYEYVCAVCGTAHQIATPTHNKIQTTGAEYRCKCNGKIYFCGKVTQFV